MNRSQKSEAIDEVKAHLKGAQVAIVAHYRGLTVMEMNELRKQMRQEDVWFKVVKNTLTRRAIKGSEFEPMGQFLNGPTGIALSEDPAAPARVLSKYAKENDKLVILGGVLDGDVLTTEDVIKLSKLPSREELLAKLMGTMQAPVQNFVGTLAAIPGGFVRVLDQIRQQKEEAGEA
ncbi:50S ribosomal protein L10 [Magnetococcales bacterium HHB-1]